MRYINFILSLLLSINIGTANGLVPWQSERRLTQKQHANRRAFLSGGVAASVWLTTASSPANAIPMVTTAEFNIIVRDSARSIDIVEFDGPKSEVVTVRLADGTTFGIKDVVESSTDPRSPLKIAATCRENKIPTRFVALESALSKVPKKTKVYTNQRVLEAAEKEKEKQARIARDEQDRLEALARMEQEEKAPAPAAAMNEESQ